MEQLSLEALTPLKVPYQLEILPYSIKTQFLQLHELVRGYIKSLDGYKQHQAHLRDVVNKLIERLNEITTMVNEYEETSKTIEEQLAKIKELHQEFINLETYHYQLLAANFNQTFLKNKFKKLVESLDQEGSRILQNVAKDENDLESSLEQFRALRKRYHLRREKLNRWDEDRVTGFI
jgi:predicted nuclease with TOPRIM domain